jgi:hypothetical protein
MSDDTMQSNIAAFFATLWGKVIGALAVLSMFIGIYIEIVSAINATNQLTITKSEAIAARGKMADTSTVLRPLSEKERLARLCETDPSYWQCKQITNPEIECAVGDDKCMEQRARKAVERIRASLRGVYGIVLAELAVASFCAKHYPTAICQRVTPTTDVLIPNEYMAIYMSLKDDNPGPNTSVYDLMKRALAECSAKYTEVRCQLQFANGSQLTEVRERLEKRQKQLSYDDLNKIAINECVALYGAPNCR